MRRKGRDEVGRKEGGKGEYGRMKEKKDRNSVKNGGRREKDRKSEKTG